MEPQIDSRKCLLYNNHIRCFVLMIQDQCLGWSVKKVQCLEDKRVRELTESIIEIYSETLDKYQKYSIHPSHIAGNPFES